jgi:hypothetical protein
VFHAPHGVDLSRPLAAPDECVALGAIAVRASRRLPNALRSYALTNTRRGGSQRAAATPERASAGR